MDSLKHPALFIRNPRFRFGHPAKVKQPSLIVIPFLRLPPLQLAPPLELPPALRLKPQRDGDDDSHAGENNQPGQNFIHWYHRKFFACPPPAGV